MALKGLETLFSEGNILGKDKTTILKLTIIDLD